MKTITTTTHRSYNYGGVLQAYALHTFQKNMGIDNLLLDYPKDNHIFKSLSSDSIRHFLINVYLNVFSLFHYKSIKSKYKAFDDFLLNNVEVTQLFNDYEELQLNYPKADLYITGSDQVFYFDKDKDLFKKRTLQFCECKKISYAASLVQFDLNDSQKNELRNIFRNFKYISLREASSCQYVKEFYQDEVLNHIDPVFLLDKNHWEKILEEPEVHKPYILCYILVSNRNTQKVVDKIKEKYKCEVIAIESSSRKTVKCDNHLYDVSPTQFLGLIANAEFVITSSFHGTAFSIIFEKKFITLIKDYKSERMTDLLSLLKIENKIIRDTDVSFNIANFTNEWNYKLTNEIIKREQQKTYNYFRELIVEYEDNN